MASKLLKYTLSFNDKKDRWELTKYGSNRTAKTFSTKKKATASGVLKKAVGKQGGSVKIQLKNGKYGEERPYPRSADPKKSKG